MPRLPRGSGLARHTASRRLDLPPCALRQGRLDASRPGIVREARRPLIGAALAVVSSAAYALADQANVATDSTTTDTIVWEKIVFGVLFLLLAARNWRSRPATLPRRGRGSSDDSVIGAAA